MITPTDSKVLDRNAEALGVPISVLMDNAGKAISDFIEEYYPDERILFVCGSGNNGGDGFAAALRMNPKRVRVTLLKKPSEIHTNEARERYSLLECPIEHYSKECLSDADVIVDCGLGTGIFGDVREPYKSFIDDVNDSGLPVISVDVPSGLGSGTVIRPKYTITFHDIKSGMDNDSCGSIVVADVGIPEDAMKYVGPGDVLRYPVPSRKSHKGDNGRVMIIAGGPYFGAPAMSAMSALRTGADIVRVFTPESVSDTIASYCPVLMVTPIAGDHITMDSVDMLLQESMNYDAVLIGPGLGRASDTIIAVKEFVRKCRTPMVIDADGLTAVAGMRLSSPTVLTPHQGEFLKLDSECMGAESIASEMNATILLKGSTDIITNGNVTRMNTTGTPAMTGAGTGDVLAGIVVALMSKGLSALDAASLGAYICGVAGEYGFQKKSYGLIATDIIDEIPTVIKNGLE